MFLDSEKTDIRRFCGYPAYGAGAAGFQGWRFFQAYGLLEYRLNNLAPTEEQVVRSYLSTLSALETAVPQAGGNLDTDRASVWTHNADEVRIGGICSRTGDVDCVVFSGCRPDLR